VARLPGVRPNGVRPDVTLPPRGGRLGRARHVETAVDEEFAFHLDLRARELVGRGWAPDAARHEARRQFGDLDDARAYCRHLGELQERRMQRLDRLHVLRDDLRLALRALRRAPVFSLAVVITLALGIGATATTAGLVDRLLFRPPAHVRAPAELRRLYVTVTEGGRMRAPDASLSYPALAAVREALGPGRSVAAYSPFATTIGGGEQAEEARVTLASGDYFALLGVRAALGRTFGSAEDVPPAGQRVAVLSDDAWRRRFGAAPDVVGRAITIAGQRFEVVGVAPRGFVGTDLTRVDAWVPLSALAGTVVGQFAPEGWERAGHVDWIRALVRVPAAPPGAAAVAARALGAYRDVQERRVGPARAEALRARVSLEPLLLERGPDRTPAARLSVWLAAMAAVVLAIACANVTNLLLARAVRRRREHAVHVALGAARWRLGARLLTESVLLAAVAGVGAVLVAHWGGAVVGRALVPDAGWDGPVVNVRLLVVAGAAAVAAGLLTGLVPALRAARGDTAQGAVAAALRAGARAGGGRRAHARDGLVVLQAALSLLLLAGAGLFVRSLHRARALDLGFAADHVLAVQVDLPERPASAGVAPRGAAPAADASLALYDRLHARLATFPGVRSVSLGMSEPFSTSLSTEVALPGRDSAAMAALLPASGPPRFNAVTPEYFATMGMRLERGRAFTAADGRGAAPVVVVNETMARRLWPGGGAVGQCVVLREVDGRPCAAVVGVVGDVRVRGADLRQGPPLQMYLPLRQELVGLSLRSLVVRGAGDPAALAAAVRRAVLAEAPGAVRVRVQPLAAGLEPELRPWRLGAAALSAFGAVALVLAALGLYAVIAYDAAQRGREIGVRLALGARAGDVARLVVVQGVRLAGLGVLLGVAAALAAGRWVAPLLFETSPYDPAVLGGVAALLLAVAALAGALPAWRAARVSPGLALRVE
jgi:predicted permease